MTTDRIAEIVDALAWEIERDMAGRASGDDRCSMLAAWRQIYREHVERACQQGWDDGYEVGYEEGLEDGQQEAT